MFASEAPSTIRSPSHPLVYPTGLRCKWIINAPTGSSVELDFTEVDTEARYDTVKVCDGSCCDGSNVVIAELSGQLENSDLFYRSSGSVLTVEFITDGTEGGRGFQADYVSVSVEAVPTPPPGTLRLVL